MERNGVALRSLMINPYWNADFFKTVWLLINRLFLLVTFQLPKEMLVEDDIAFLALLLMGISCVFSGTFLVIKRMTLLINSLSHTILLGIVATAGLLLFWGWGAFSPGAFLLAAFLTGMMTVGSTQILIGAFRVQREAAIGFMFTTLFGLGVLISTLFFRNTHLGVEAVFGNIDAVMAEELLPLSAILLLNLVWMVLFYPRIVFSTFDPVFSNLLGISQRGLAVGGQFLLSLSIVSGFQSVGVVIIMAFFCLPTLIARQFTENIKKILLIGSIATFLSALVSVGLTRDFLTYHSLPLSTGAVAALLLFTGYLVVGLTFNKKGFNLNRW